MAAKIAARHSLKEVYVNKSGEFFTNENTASLSVGGKKDDFAKISINTVTSGKEEKLPGENPVGNSNKDESL